MRTEFEFLGHLKDHFNLDKIGDDCAVFPKDDSHDYLISSDMLVEDVDFRLDWTRPKFLGHRALTISISDIAAMGGEPKFSIVSLAVPEMLWKTDFLDEFYEGYMRLARTFGIELVGGDISVIDDSLVIDSTVVGMVPKGDAILRSGARPGHLLCVTGSLGGAAGGLELLKSGVRFNDGLSDWQKHLLLRQLQPFPSEREGLVGIASALIDLSDGLSSDLAHICSASGVGARVFSEKVPVDKNLHGLKLSEEEKLDLALNGGEDFELLLAAEAKKIPDTANSPIIVIGEITNDVGNIELIVEGESRPLEPKGYRHF